jgi:hypothetical protein
LRSAAEIASVATMVSHMNISTTHVATETLMMNKKGDMKLIHRTRRFIIPICRASGWVAELD